LNTFNLYKAEIIYKEKSHLFKVKMRKEWTWDKKPYMSIIFTKKEALSESRGKTSQHKSVKYLHSQLLLG